MIPSSGSAGRLSALGVVEDEAATEPELEPDGIEGVARGVGAGRGDVDGEERNDDKAVIWDSVRSDTRALSGICILASRSSDVWCDTP